MRQRIVVMGVTGAGKSTIGARLAQRVGVPFADADDLHTPQAVAKMASGQPLDDADRAPWLDAVGAWLAAQADGGVIACSALKRAYRDALRAQAPTAVFVHLTGDSATAARRVAARPGHFMPASLVASQFEALEPLGADERGIEVDFTLGTDAIVDAVLAHLPLGRT